MDTQDYTHTSVEEYSEELQQLFTGSEHNVDGKVYKNNSADTAIVDGSTESDVIETATPLPTGALYEEAIKKQVSDENKDVDMEVAEDAGIDTDATKFVTEIAEVKEETSESINVESREGSVFVEEAQQDNAKNDLDEKMDTNEPITEHAETVEMIETPVVVGSDESLEEVVSNGAKEFVDCVGKDSEATNINADSQTDGKLQEMITIEEISNASADVGAEVVDIEPIVAEEPEIETHSKDGSEIQPDDLEDTTDDPQEEKDENLTENETVEISASAEENVDDPETIEVIELTEISSKERKKLEENNPNIKHLKIPQHVMGRNIEKPVEDKFSNGRIPPKPRLGVKVPYRNLTSQIVSKQEIEDVIMERARLKNAAHDPPAGGDVFFAKKLTQRLAKKIAPTIAPKTEQPTKSKETENNDTIKDDSDLIAILEGDGDDLELPQQSKPEEMDDEDFKKREKEIALKQLEQLPNRRRGRIANDPNSQKKYGGKNESHDGDKTKSLPHKTTEKLQEFQKKLTLAVQKTSAKKDGTYNGEGDSKEDDMVPRFATNSVVKTYTRKRKASDGVAPVTKAADREDEPNKDAKEATEQRIPIDLPNTTYITKSSRVIKKKIIWDPDEAASPIKKNKLSTTKVDVKPSSSKIEAKVLKVETATEKVNVAQKQSPVAKEKMTVSPEEKSPSKKIDKTLATPKKNKRLTEIDRLLMDEGAVNMLYDVKNTEENISNKKRKISTISKTKEIKNDLQVSSKRESPKSLRKKEPRMTPPPPPPPAKKDTPQQQQPGAISRKKSKDSNRSSVHSPPASPAMCAEASRIIRRHSSSSFSSDDEHAQQAAVSEKNVPEMVKPEKPVKRKVGIMDKVKKAKEALTAAEKVKVKEEMSKSFGKILENKYEDLKTMKVKIVNKVAQVFLSSVKKETLLTVQTLNELTGLLDRLEQDEDCHVVSVTSQGRSFCHGLDYRYLVSDDLEERNRRARETAEAIKAFLKKLSVFPKFLGAAVDGNVVGAGVTMLPLFDMVLASDRTTFSVPCAKLGCSEAGCHLLALPHLSNCAVTCELLYSSQKISADDAASHGLVTRTILPEKFQEQAFTAMEMIARQSKQSIRGTKKLLRESILASVEENLNKETDILVEQWMSDECQQNFAKYKPE